MRINRHLTEEKDNIFKTMEVVEDSWAASSTSSATKIMGNEA